MSVDTAKLRELHARSTPGEWVCMDRGDGSGSVRAEDDPDSLELLDDAQCPYMRGEVSYEDGLFAAEAHAIIPEWADEIDRLRKDAAAMKDALVEARSHIYATATDPRRVDATALLERIDAAIAAQPKEEM